MSEAVTVSEISLRMRIAEEIQVLLVRRRMSTAQLARSIGMKQPYMSRRMTGEVAWDVDDLERIAAVLGVEVADLLPRPMPGRVVTAVGERGAQPNDRKAAQAERPMSNTKRHSVQADRPTPARPSGHPHHAVPAHATRRPARVASHLAHV